MIQPRCNNLVIRVQQAEMQTKSGGLIIPDVAREKPQEAIVVAVGPGRRTDEGVLIPMDVQVGDRVVYGKYSGMEFKSEGEDLVIISEDDILAVYNQEESNGQ